MKLTEKLTSDKLLALQLLIHKVGRKWKKYVRALAVPGTHIRSNLQRLGLSDAMIHDLTLVRQDWLPRLHAPAIADELRSRRADGRIVNYCEVMPQITCAQPYGGE